MRLRHLVYSLRLVVAALLDGADSLTDAEDAAVRAAIGEAAGRDVLHLQGHLAFDAISLVRRGARVTALDFSPVALAKAGELAARCGTELDLVQADATAIPTRLHARFDLVYATIGVLSWIPDIAAWMRSVRSALRPGGRVALVELHPIFSMFAQVDPPVLDFPYADDGGRAFDEAGSYADPGAEVQATASVGHAHALGEVVTAAIGAGLRIERLDEHLDAAFDPRGNVLAREADGRYRLRLDGEPLPVLYTLIAARPR